MAENSEGNAGSTGKVALPIRAKRLQEDSEISPNQLLKSRHPLVRQKPPPFKPTRFPSVLPFPHDFAHWSSAAEEVDTFVSTLHSLDVRFCPLPHDIPQTPHCETAIRCIFEAYYMRYLMGLLAHKGTRGAYCRFKYWYWDTEPPCENERFTGSYIYLRNERCEVVAAGAFTFDRNLHGDNLIDSCISGSGHCKAILANLNYDMVHTKAAYCFVSSCNATYVARRVANKGTAAEKYGDAYGTLQVSARFKSLLPILAYLQNCVANSEPIEGYSTWGRDPADYISWLID